MTLAQVRKLALALPEVSEEPHFNRTSFRIRGKVMATALPDEAFLHLMVSESVREPALAMYADWIEKLFWGEKVCGLRIELKQANADAVADLLRQSWMEKAPKSLSSQK